MEKLLFIFLLSLAICSSATDSIPLNRSLADGETIVSADGSFELGFFSPSSSKHRYLGIWYTFSIETIVWVANRQTPLNDTSGLLQVAIHGIILLNTQNNLTVWTSKPMKTEKQPRNPVAQILNSGNLVLREVNGTSEDDYLWESFASDVPRNIIIAGSKFGRSLKTGVEWLLVSWKNRGDPSFGDAMRWLDTNGYPQVFMSVNGSVGLRSGPWNGYYFAGLGNLKPNPFFSYQLVSNDEEIYIKTEQIDKSSFFHLVLTNNGYVEQRIWNNTSKNWSLYASTSRDDCDNYATCGPFGVCCISYQSFLSCKCLSEFTPRFPRLWSEGNWSGGCARNVDLHSSHEIRFQKVEGVKLPNTNRSRFISTMSQTDCEKECSRNFSCTAYSSLVVYSTNGCMLWFEDLIDIRHYRGSGQSFHLKLGTKKGSCCNKTVVLLLSGLGLASIIVFLIGFILLRNYMRNKAEGTTNNDEMEFPLFSLKALTQATRGFSDENLIGKGGFGPVYMGELSDGRRIAVKRLSKESTQGEQEFKAEVVMIAKLQHRNLTKILGYCMESDEKLLVYEFLPNRSLNHFIFDQEKREQMGWDLRFLIIDGIARGLLYLHQDSRLKIIHRDLKTSNILLDADMTPKISDFGLARMVSADQTDTKTMKVSGSHGYMSPEYAVDGVFSTRSDVFSFGVIVLEILSGKKNKTFSSPHDGNSLLGHAWNLWKSGSEMKLVPETVENHRLMDQISRSVHIGLLCVQQRPDDRPAMDSVVLMLSSEGPLPQPARPGFFMARTVSQISDHSCLH